MAFPPNYRQERSNRDRSKQRKAEEKLNKRMEKSSQRKTTDQADAPETPVAADSPISKDD